MNIRHVLDTLNDELNAQNLERELVVCGGAALILLGVISRLTRDVDVLSPELDAELKAISEKIAPSLGLKSNWLNNGPIALAKELPKGWESRATVAYEKKNLIVKAISRIDLIYSKIYAACDRQSDLRDLVALKPSNLELKKAEEWVLKQDAADIWPKIVSECLDELKRRLSEKN